MVQASVVNMNLIREKISKLTTEDRIQIFSEYDQFEKNGFIGDCKLRSIAELFGDVMHVTLFMNIVAAEVWRSFCIERLNEIEENKYE